MGPDPASGKPRQVSRSFRGSDRARRQGTRLFGGGRGGRKVQAHPATVGQLLDRWLDLLRNGSGPRIGIREQKQDQQSNPTVLGNVRLDKLEADTLDGAYRLWLDEGLSPSTVHQYHAILSAACRQAVKWGWIDRAPTDRATAPQPVRKKHDSSDAQAAVRIGQGSRSIRPGIGDRSRPGRAYRCPAGRTGGAPMVGHRLAAGRLIIARSLTVASGEQHTGPTKTHAARELALDPIGVEVLKRRWAYMTDLADRAESRLVDDPYVLSYNANGALPVNPDTLTHRFAQLCQTMEKPAFDILRKTTPKAKRTDLPAAHRWPFRLHDLRHFSVTTLIAAGVDVRTVAERHGHAKATMTLDRYAHALPERDRAAAGILGDVLSSAIPASGVTRTQ